MLCKERGRVEERKKWELMATCCKGNNKKGSGWKRVVGKEGVEWNEKRGEDKKRRRK